MSEIQFVKIGESEIEEIRNMANVVFPNTYRSVLSQNQIEYMLEMMYSVKSLQRQFDEGCEFYVFKSNKKNIGFGSFQVISHLAKLHKIYFLEQSQGKGFGQKFIKFTSEIAKKSGAKSLQLNVNRYNKAVDFYKKLNFKVSKSEDNDIGGGFFMNDYVMELIL
jgi:diamine N-acetyltransferase